MLNNLMESRPRQLLLGRRIASNTVSIAVHAGFIFGAIFLTMKPPVQVLEEKRDAELIIFRDTPDRTPPPVEIQNPYPDRILRTVTAPIEVPIGIPPVDLRTVFVLDKTDAYFEADVALGGDNDGTSNVSLEVFRVAAVDEAPVRISSPPLEYPRAMHRAGIEGVVVIQAIVDSTGRVEPASVKIVRSDNKAFEGAATRLLNRSIFQPGRVRGRPVRVLIQIPIQFALVDRGC